MAYILIDIETFTIAYQIDCEENEQMETPLDTTQYAVESGASITDYVIQRPETFSITGSMTAIPFGASPPSSTRLSDEVAKIRTLAKKGQPVFFVAPYWTSNVIITSVRQSATQQDGGQTKVQIAMRTFDTVIPATINIPASLLRPKIKKRVAPKTPSGAQTGKPAGNPTKLSKLKTWAAKKAS